MPTLTPGAKTTDLSAQAQAMGAGKTPTPWGRVKAAVRYAIAGVTPDTWMSPNQPVAPVAQEAFGRNRDYPVGYNLYWTPRGGELSSFAQLRALADNCDLVRMAIETRKDQVSALTWNVTHIDPAKNTHDDQRVQRIEAMLKTPDGVQDWQTWLRVLLEDLFVIDAPAVLPRRLNSGEVVGFEVIDGALIKPLVDDRGRTPLPPSPAYQQAIKGMPAVDYRSDELIYRPRNPRSHKFYGYSPVEQIMLSVNIAIRRAVSQLQYYTEGNIPAAFVNVPNEWTPQQIEQFQAYWDTVIEGDQAQKRKVRFVPAGTSSKPLTEPPLKDEFDEWLARIVCYAFSLPPTAFVRQMNRSTSETQKDSAQEEGLAPIMAWVKSFMDVLIQTFLGCPDLQFQWFDQDIVDPQEQATVLTTYQAHGIYTINEIRAKLGEDPIAGVGGDDRFIITGAAVVRLEDAVNPPQPPALPAPAPDLKADGNGKNDSAKGGTDATHTTGEPPEITKPKVSPSKDGGDRSEKHDHGHGGFALAKASGELSPREHRLKASVLAALQVVRDGVVEQARKIGAPVAKAADGTKGKDGKPDNVHASLKDVPVPPESVSDWLALPEDADTSGLSLAWDDLTDELIATAQDGARFVVAKIALDDGEPIESGADIVETPGEEWAKQHVAELITKDGQGGKLADVTRDMVRETIESGMKDGDSQEQIAQALHDAYAFSPERAELIATTEVHNAKEQGGYLAAVGVGAKVKHWMLSNDDNACPRCTGNAEEQWIPIDQPFSSGDQAPLAHPRCRCNAGYRREPRK